MQINNLEYLLALHFVEGLGPIRLKKILEYFKDSKLAWEANLSEVKSLGIPENVIGNLKEARRKFNPEKNLEDIFKAKIKVLTVFDEDYPKLLKEIYDPPIILYYQGEIPKSNLTIGIVGTRKITGYGKLVTSKFASELTKAGFIIVSGLARGVDTQAHQACIEADGKTLAILGGGLNYIFPPENHNLARKIANGFGAVVSEYPPDNPSLPGNFPARNRIISGLSLGVVVTEAAEDSGSLITARLALEQGKEVYAVPGPITSSLTKGPASLIKEGAKLVLDPQEIIEDLGVEGIKNAEFKVMNEENLNGEEKIILNCLANESKHVDEICRQLEKDASLISASLIKMEILGFVKNLGGGNYVKS